MERKRVRPRKGEVGRPSKGTRARYDVQVPEALAVLLNAAADAEGNYRRNEWIVEAIAARLGVPYPEQERLPISA